nr:uncharacterized protein LOC123753242 [Procambarus clarkii]
MNICELCKAPKLGPFHVCQARCAECRITFTASPQHQCVIYCEQCYKIPRGHFDKICPSCSKVICSTRRNPDPCPFCMYLVDSESDTSSDSEHSEASSHQSVQYESSPTQQLVEVEEEYPRGGGGELPSTLTNTRR